MQKIEPLSSEALVSLAVKLQANYAKEAAGEPRLWSELSQEERRIWIRVAKRAADLVVAELNKRESGTDA